MPKTGSLSLSGFSPPAGGVSAASASAANSAAKASFGGSSAWWVGADIFKPRLKSDSATGTPSHHGKVKEFVIMNIGAASAASGISAKMIRHYEAIALLRPAVRRDNSYRDYGTSD